MNHPTMKRILGAAIPILLIAAWIGFSFFQDRLFDETLDSVATDWHGTYELDRDDPFWSDDYDLRSDELRITIREASVVFLGKRYEIQKVTTPRYKTKYPAIDIYIADYHRLQLHRLDSNRLAVDESMRTPSGPDRESWGIHASYKFNR